MKSYEAKRSKVRRSLKKIVDSVPSHIPFTRVGSKLLVFFSNGWEFAIEPKWSPHAEYEQPLRENLEFYVRILRTEDGVEKLSTVYDLIDQVAAHLNNWIRETV